MSEQPTLQTGSPLTPPIDADDHSTGPESVPVTLLEFGDFECPHCGRAYPIVKDVKAALGEQLRVVYRHFPLTNMHEHAQMAAEAAEAAAEQGAFWEMHDHLFEHQDWLTDDDLVSYAADLGLDVDQFERELDKRTYRDAVRENFLSGVKSGVNGTPTFFINGTRYDGEWDRDTLLAALQAAADDEQR
jgi:protein-disulfide isomerase